MNGFQVEHPFAMDRLNGPDDFRVEWDVPSLGKPFTDSLSRDIDLVRLRPAPDPELDSSGLLKSQLRCVFPVRILHRHRIPPSTKSC